MTECLERAAVFAFFMHKLGEADGNTFVTQKLNNLFDKILVKGRIKTLEEKKAAKVDNKTLEDKKAREELAGHKIVENLARNSNIHRIALSVIADRNNQLNDDLLSLAIKYRANAELRKKLTEHD